MNKAKISQRLAALSAVSLLAVGSAHAALPDSVATSITAYQTDALSAIGLIMAAGVAIWGLLKLASKLGWR